MTCGQLSLLLQAEDEPIWVLDTSALIAFKYLISGPEQWHAFERLTVLVDEARIAMPRQVINEVAEVAHPDVPGVWAPGMRDRLRHPLDGDFEYVQRVMSEAGDVVEAESTKDEADPYVIALALQLSAIGQRTVVVTEDKIDHRPIRISLASACEVMGVEWTDGLTFLNTVGIPVRPGEQGS
jgi:hypothetical protein